MVDSEGNEARRESVIGDPIDKIRSRIRSGGHRLLVCNSVAPDHKLIQSLAYNLAVYLREVPLLLL